MTHAVSTVFKGLQTWATYDNSKSELRSEQKDVADMINMVGNVAYAAGLYFAAQKLLACGYSSKAAYALYAAGTLTAIQAGAMLGAALIGVKAYQVLSPAVKNVWATRNYANFATQQNALGALYAFVAYKISSTAGFKYIQKAFVAPSKVAASYGVNFVGQLIQDKAEAASRWAVKTKQSDT